MKILGADETRAFWRILDEDNLDCSLYLSHPADLGGGDIAVMSSLFPCPFARDMLAKANMMA